MNPNEYKTPPTRASIWLSRANRVREAIKTAYEYDSTTSRNLMIKRDPGIPVDRRPIKVEKEDLEMAKRMAYRAQGIEYIGGM